MVNGAFRGEVAFSATGVPEGASVSFSAASATGPKIGATRMTVTTTEATPPGVHEITILGTCGEMEKTTVVTLVVEAATVPPPAPSGLRVTGVGRGEVSLAWDSVPGATGYNIMSSRKPRPTSGQYRPGVEYQIIADTAETNITLPLLAGEAVYYYFVTAVNAAGEGPYSTTVFGRTLAIAGAPPVISSSLSPLAVASGAAAVELHATVSGDPAPMIHWQVSRDNGAHWEDIIDDGNYEGAQSASLKIKSAGPSMNGYLYRCMAANVAGSATSANTTKLVVLAHGFQAPAGVAQDREGNFYVTDAVLHTVQKMDWQGNIIVLAGSAGKSGFVNGTGEVARFSAPTGLKINPKSGVLHIADTGNNAVRSLTASGEAGSLVDGFNAPAGIAVDNDGNIYVADTENHAIRKITTDGAVTLLAGSGDSALSGTTDATGTAARFNHPKGVAVDASNYIYVADSGNHSIRYIRPSDNYVGTLAGVAGVPGCVDGPEEFARFRNPEGIAVDGVLLSGSADGSLYVADTGNSSIREIARGIVRTVAGHPGIDDEPAIAGVPGFRDGTGTNAWFRYPEDVALTADGNLVVADTGNGLLRKVTFDNDDNAVVTAVFPAMAGTGGGDNGGGNDGGGEVKGGSGGGAVSWWWLAGASILLAVHSRHRGKYRKL
jgi:sugar lactone lactonase YvrE